MVDVDLFTVCAVGAIIVLVYRYIAKKYEYFLTKPVPCIKPTLPVGSTGPLLFGQMDNVSLLKKLYNAFPESKVTGFYDLTRPVFLVRDPEIVKKIGIKDFDHFIDRTFITFRANKDGEINDLFGSSLFALRGPKWRDMRASLSPAFTGSRMRKMFELLEECGKSMANYFLDEAKAGKTLEYEMKDIFSRFGTDVIATVAFGIKVDSLREQTNEFFSEGKRMLSFKSITTLGRFMMLRCMPWLAQKLDIQFVEASCARYFKRVIQDNMKQRETRGIVRNDMIHMLMEMQKGALKHQQEEQDTKDAGFATVEESSVGKATHSRVWTETELIAQCLVFFFAGFDTTSSCLAFLVYELAINPNVQDRLYDEVHAADQALDGNALTYEVLQKMKYLDMVVSELLRKWPPVVVLDRLCTKDYQYDDGVGTRFIIEKGRSIWIPAAAIHNDPKNYPDPEKFDPERFNEENRSKINTGAYIPFGVGPRNCIGSRLALMEVKSIIFCLLKAFSFEPTEKTQIPIKLAKNVISPQGEKGVWVQLKPRNV